MNENQFKITRASAESSKDMILHKQLKSLITQHDTTVAQLARATQISSKTIYQWMNGQKPRDLNQVRRVADHFSVTIDYLVFGIVYNKTQTEFKEYADEINAGVFEVILRKKDRFK